LDQTTGGTRATALLDVPQHGEGLVVGKPRALQDRALALGEVAFAGAAVDHADALAFATPAAEGEISSAAHALIGAAGILATEVFNRVQWPSSLTTRDCPFMAYANTRHPANHTEPIEFWPDTTGFWVPSKLLPKYTLRSKSLSVKELGDDVCVRAGMVQMRVTQAQQLSWHKLLCQLQLLPTH
jgi:hypothetical protein